MLVSFRSPPSPILTAQLPPSPDPLIMVATEKQPPGDSPRPPWGPGYPHEHFCSEHVSGRQRLSSVGTGGWQFLAYWVPDVGRNFLEQPRLDDTALNSNGDFSSVNTISKTAAPHLWPYYAQGGALLRGSLKKYWHLGLTPENLIELPGCAILIAILLFPLTGYQENSFVNSLEAGVRVRVAEVK